MILLRCDKKSSPLRGYNFSSLVWMLLIVCTFYISVNAMPSTQFTRAISVPFYLRWLHRVIIYGVVRASVFLNHAFTPSLSNDVRIYEIIHIFELRS